MKDPSVSWVFYERLKSDAEKDKERPELFTLYNEGVAKVEGAHFSVTNTARNDKGQALITMANAELAKEQALLNNMFNANVNFDLQKPGAVKEIIDTLNACLNLKNVYERNKQLITSGTAKKGVFTYFNTYLLQAFDERRLKIRDKIVRRFESDAEFFLAVKEVLDYEFDTYIIPTAIEKMLNADVEKGVDKKYLDAYKEVLRAVTSFPNNPLSEGLRKAWNLEELVHSMALDISDAVDKDHIDEMFHKYQKKTIINKNNKKQNVRTNSDLRNAISRGKSYANQAGGLSMEALEDMIFSMVANEIPNFSVEGQTFSLKGGVQANTIKGLGYKKMRPDAAVTFNLNSAPIEQALNNTKGNDRKTANNLFNKIGSQVEKIKDGFIVYTNAKNYTLNSDFRSRGGYSAGEALTLERLEIALGKFIDNVDDLIEVLLNAGNGAIKQGDTGDASEILAQAIAFALFDDWNYIGNFNQGGGNSLHVMNLNGVLIPLSVFLFSLGRAIQTAEEDPSNFVKVSITTATYPTEDHTLVYGMDFWHRSIAVGKMNTKISYHFMKNIVEFLKLQT